MQDRTITVRCKAFTGHGIQENSCLVTEAAVLVWDDVAGHYTNCHSMTPAAQRRIRRMAVEAERDRLKCVDAMKALRLGQ